MPFVQKIINFMQRKSFFLPKELQSIYFGETDESKLRDTWESSQAKQVCYSLFNTLNTILKPVSEELPGTTKEEINDAHLCPYCIKINMRCSNCEYFFVHGCCFQRNSDYAFIVDRLWGIGSSKGIYNYILENYGVGAIIELKNIVIDESNLNMIFIPEPNDVA